MLIGAEAGAAATLPMTIAMERLHEWLPGEPPRPLPPREIIEGVADQAASYLGWLTATGVRHHPKHDPPARTGLMIAAHIVYGAATGAFVAAARPRR